MNRPRFSWQGKSLLEVLLLLSLMRIPLPGFGQSQDTDFPAPHDTGTSLTGSEDAELLPSAPDLQNQEDLEDTGLDLPLPRELQDRSLRPELSFQVAAGLDLSWNRTASLPGAPAPAPSRVLSAGSATELGISVGYRSGAFAFRSGITTAILTGSRADNLSKLLYACAAAELLSPGSGTELARQSGLPDLVLAPGYSQGTSLSVTSPQSLATLTIDELSAGLSGRNLAITAGRMVVNSGQGKAFSPADIFTAFDRSRTIPVRRGSDVVELAFYPGPLSRATVTARPAARIHLGSYAGRLAGQIADLQSADLGDIQISGALGAAWKGGEQTWLATPELRIDTAIATLYAEAAWRFLNGSGVMPSSPAAARSPSLPGEPAGTSPWIEYMVGGDTSIAGWVLTSECSLEWGSFDSTKLFASISRSLGEEGTILAACTWLAAEKALSLTALLALDQIADSRMRAGLTVTRQAAVPGPELARWTPSVSITVEKAF